MFIKLAYFLDNIADLLARYLDTIVWNSISLSGLGSHVTTLWKIDQPHDRLYLDPQWLSHQYATHPL